MTQRGRNLVWALKWPFLGIVDGFGRPTGWALLNGPVVTPRQQQQFAELRWAGYRLAGMSSYMGFPRVEDGDAMEYEGACEVWCHCFRHPDRFLATDIPRALISVSDFTDYRRVNPATIPQGSAAEHVDFVYVGGTADWQRRRKNWALAAQCIPQLCEDLGLRCLVIGAPTADFLPSRSVSFSAPLPRRSFLSMVAASRFLFVPNEIDASPRVIAEALCLDVPVVANRNILGGWKYISHFTGTFFTGTDDVVAAVSAFLFTPQAPRAWFRANYGPDIASERLLCLLRSVDPALSGCQRVRLPAWCREPTAVR